MKYFQQVVELIRQGFDWDWCIKDNDIAENRLTIKFRKGKARWATYFALKWN